jgi:hypothetical protein
VSGKHAGPVDAIYGLTSQPFQIIGFSFVVLNMKIHEVPQDQGSDIAAAKWLS